MTVHSHRLPVPPPAAAPAPQLEVTDPATQQHVRQGLHRLAGALDRAHVWALAASALLRAAGLAAAAGGPSAWDVLLLVVPLMMAAVAPALRLVGARRLALPRCGTCRAHIHRPTHLGCIQAGHPQPGRPR